MEANIRLGRIWGIPIGLHTSWFLVAGLLTWSLATGYFAQEYPQLALGNRWLLAGITSLLFFGSVLAHELGHAFLALRNGIPVRSISLFIFGGVAQIEQEPRTPGMEFRIAIAGPLVSLGLALLFEGLWLLDRAIPLLAAPSQYLMRINLILALFNLIPGFPLDGGRVLRAAVWKLTGSLPKATRAASFSGQIVAFGFIGFGIYSILNGRVLDGIWLAFIGWFLQNAAAAAYAQMNVQEALRGLTVGQVMSREIVQIPPLTSLNQVVNERVLASGQTTFYVAGDEGWQGMLTLGQIAAVPEPKRRFTTIAQVMTPWNRLVQVDSSTDLLSALQSLETANQAQAPVLYGGQLVGTLSREQVFRYLRGRAELKI